MKKDLKDRLNDWMAKKAKQNPWMKTPASWLLIGLLSAIVGFSIGTEYGGYGDPRGLIAVPLMLLLFWISGFSFIIFIILSMSYLVNKAKR